MGDDVPAWVTGDVTRLRQILVNLVSNAIKFTTEGEVVVSLAATASGDGPHEVEIDVRDTGIGIPRDRVDRLFRPFSQVDASTTRRFGGTGLGLAISKRLAELMGGSLGVESEPGVGSVFRVRVPFAAAPDEKPHEDAAAAASLSGRHLLVVDDNATNREILERQTRSWGMLPRATALPAEALAWVRAGERFDLAVLDLQMPDMDGLALAAVLRAEPASRGLPMVLLSSAGPPVAPEPGQPDPARLFAAMLTKPARASVLRDALARACGRPRAVAGRSAREGRIEREMARRLPLRILLAEDNADEAARQREGIHAALAHQERLEGVAQIDLVGDVAVLARCGDERLPDLVDVLEQHRVVQVRGIAAHDAHDLNADLALGANAQVFGRRIAERRQRVRRLGESLRRRNPAEQQRRTQQRRYAPCGRARQAGLVAWALLHRVAWEWAGRGMRFGSGAGRTRRYDASVAQRVCLDCRAIRSVCFRP